MSASAMGAGGGESESAKLAGGISMDTDDDELDAEERTPATCAPPPLLVTPLPRASRSMDGSSVVADTLWPRGEDAATDVAMDTGWVGG